MKRFDEASNSPQGEARRSRIRPSLGRSFLFCLCIAAIGLAGLSYVARDAGAETARRLPTFDMKGLDEQEHSLTDERFEGKTVLVTCFGTWQHSSIEQARELQKFHEANPDVEIIAFVAANVPNARDFREREGLTFGCYKLDGTAPVADIFSRLFVAKRGQEVTLNRVPFVIMAEENRTVSFANIGLTPADRLSEELARIGD